MPDPAKQAELDQANAELSEALSDTWWALYSRCVDHGFTEDQAMRLVEAFILSEPFSNDNEQED